MPTLRKRHEFLRLRSGRHFHTPHFLLQASQHPADSEQASSGPVRVGYTVTAKTGKAVVRSRIKRRLREIANAVFPTKAKPGHDYVLVGKRQALVGDFAAMKNDLSIALDRVHAKRANGAKRKGKPGRSKPPTGTET